VELKRSARLGFRRITPLSSARYMKTQVIDLLTLFSTRNSPPVMVKAHACVLGIEKGVEGIKLEEKPAEEKKDRSQVKDKSAQLEAKLEKENQKKMQSHVIIKRVERTKRKCVTTIHGLEVFGKKFFDANFSNGNMAKIGNVH
jgi:hypothetical protein